MFNKVTPHNYSAQTASFDFKNKRSVNKEWTVLTFEWDVESLLRQLRNPSSYQSHARFSWKAPDNSSSHNSASHSSSSKGEEFIALGKLDALKATGERRFHDLAQAEQSLRAKTHFVNFRANQDTAVPFVVGGAAFHQFNIDPTWSAFGSTQFILPRLVVGKDDKGQGYLRFTLPSKEADAWLGQIQNTVGSQRDTFLEEKLEQTLQSEGVNLHEDLYSTGGDTTDLVNETMSLRERLQHAASQQKEAWISRFEKAIHGLQHRSIKKVVLARQAKVRGVTSQERAHLQRSLQERYQNCIHFCVEPMSSASFFGATPERLLRMQGQQLHIDALAGSRSRGKTSIEDQELAHDLLHADKDAMEHDIVKRQILEVLNPFSKQLRYPSSPLLKALPNVQHLHTPIEAELEHSTSVFDLIAQLHPTPAVGGYPKADALGVIEQMEPQNRGWYAGIVGWVSEQGDADIAVSIRSASHIKDTLTLYAGCGLVEGSIPEQEWDETYVKLAPFLEAAEDVAHV